MMKSMSDELRAAIAARGITEVVHFTTNKGLTGILYSKALKSRKRLDRDEELKYIFGANAALRKDDAWLDYVNLSISEVNARFFDICAGKWHVGKDLWWCVLAFAPEILCHKGVVFTTTNNIYTGVSRAEGLDGFEATFAPRVIRWSTNIAVRGAATSENLTTCEQAEILYPGFVDTEYLKRIYVSSGEDSDEVYGLFAAMNHPKVEVVIDAQKLRGKRR